MQNRCNSHNILSHIGKMLHLALVFRVTSVVIPDVRFKAHCCNVCNSCKVQTQDCMAMHGCHAVLSGPCYFVIHSIGFYGC